MFIQGKIFDIGICLLLFWLLKSIRPFSLKITAIFPLVVGVAAHFAYIFFIFPKTGGLDPIYNDEIFFLNYNPGTCSLRYVLSALFTFDAGQAAPFACLVQGIKATSEYPALVIRLLNCTALLGLVLFLLKQDKESEKNQRVLLLASFLILLSPSLLFFSTKVLRDTLITVLLTMSFFFLRQRRPLFWLGALAGIFILRRHLAVALFFGYVVSLFDVKPLTGAAFAMFVAFALSLLNIPPFVDFAALFSKFFLVWPFSASGLHFLVADSSMFNASFERVVLQRALAPDTFLPLVVVNIFVLLSHQKDGLYNKIMRFLFPCNVWYLYFYFTAGFTSARQTVLPFLPLIFIALADLAVSNNWLKKSVKKEQLPPSLLPTPTPS